MGFFDIFKGKPAASKPRPRTPYDAKFSLPFTAGALLVHGRVGVATFTPEGIEDAAAADVARRMSYEAVPLQEMASSFGGAVAVRTADGRTLERLESARAYLANNDSYHYFEKLGDLIKTGPTNTNVMDVRLIIVGRG